MSIDQLNRWLITARQHPLIHHGTGIVALDSRVYATDVSGPFSQHIIDVRSAISRHDLPQTEVVTIDLPPYRPRSLVRLLASIAGKLACPTGSVHWKFQAKERGMVKRCLMAAGWNLAEISIDAKQELVLPPPRTPINPPLPAHIQAWLGTHDVSLFADYGVFSPTHLDEGTQLLLHIALREPETPEVADIGTGYGPLAIGMLLNGRAHTAYATDTDLIAFYLASLNAEQLGLPIQCSRESDPARIPPTALTLCNLPTHVERSMTDLLLDGLAIRARHGLVLMVVHASLQSRYQSYLDQRGMEVSAHTGANHAVLRFGKGHGPPLTGSVVVLSVGKPTSFAVTRLRRNVGQSDYVVNPVTGH